MASSYMSLAASGDNSKNGVPESIRVMTRCRGRSLPRARCRSRARGGPPSAAVARRLSSSAISARMAAWLARNSLDLQSIFEAIADTNSSSQAEFTGKFPAFCIVPTTHNPYTQIISGDPRPILLRALHQRPCGIWGEATRHLPAARFPRNDSASGVALAVCFSNRPFGVKRFQTIHHHSVDVARRLVLLFGISATALPSWVSRTRWNNLKSGLAVRRYGRSKQTDGLISPIVPRGTSFHRSVELEIFSYRI